MVTPERVPLTHLPPRLPPGTRADYGGFVPITTRWMDNDAFGHLNNVVYYSLMDTAVTRSFVERGLLGTPGHSHFLVMAESGCRYHHEVAFPDLLQVGVRVARVGERSIRHEAGVFRDGMDVAAAEGFMVHVCVDAVTRRPAPIPEAWRAALGVATAHR